MGTIKEKGTLAQRAFHSKPVIILLGHTSDVATQVEYLQKNYKNTHKHMTLFVNECSKFNPETDTLSEWVKTRISKVRGIDKNDIWFEESFSWARKILCEYTGGPIVITDFPKNLDEVEKITNFFYLLGKKVFSFYLQNDTINEELYRTWATSVQRCFTTTKLRSYVCTIHVNPIGSVNNTQILNFLEEH